MSAFSPSFPFRRNAAVTGRMPAGNVSPFSSAGTSARRHDFWIRAAKKSAPATPRGRGDDDDSLYVAPPPEAKTVDDILIVDASYGLRRLSWFSWWCQVILTTISSVTLVFGRGVKEAAGGLSSASAGSVMFLLAGSGVGLSALSIIWTWGYCRLARRLLRPSTNRISAANLLRRALSTGAVINFMGIAATLIGAEQIVGVLFAKVLSLSNGAGVLLGGGGAGAVASQSIQPLDILIVQANTNTLLSHYIALAVSFWLSRWVKRLDPPSTVEDPR